MANLGTAYIKIAPNMSGIQSKIQSGVRGTGTAVSNIIGDEASKNTGAWSKFTSGLGNVAAKAGKVIAAGFAAGATGLTVLTGKMLGARAELEQQLGGSEAVFGEYAANIQKIAQDAYKNMGLSQNDFIAGANKMASLYQGMGVSVKDSMDMSAAAIQRATDVASIMGIDTSSALESVTAMAKGNFTMMDNLGVAMNDTALNAYALEKGIKKTTAQMQLSEKVQLATQMFLEKSAKYAGNYAKENETLSGSLNTTKKAFADFLSGGGNMKNFVDSLINTIKIAAKEIVKIMPDLANSLTTLVSDLVPVIAELIPTLLPAVIDGTVALLNALVAAMPQIIQALVAAIPMLIQGVMRLVLGVLQALPQIIQMITASLPQIIKAIVDTLTSPENLIAIMDAGIELLLALVDAIPDIIVALVDALPTIIENIVTTLLKPEFILKMINAGIRLIGGLITGIGKMIGSVVTSAGEILGKIGEALHPSKLFEIGVNMVKGLWEGIKSVKDWVFEKIGGFFGGVLDGIKDFFGIHSPSTVFAEIGENLNRGLVVGLEDSLGLVEKSASNVAGAILDEMAGVDAAMSGTLNRTYETGVNAQTGAYAPAPAQIIQNNEFIVNDEIDMQKAASDLGYMVSMA